MEQTPRRSSRGGAKQSGTIFMDASCVSPQTAFGFPSSAQQTERFRRGSLFGAEEPELTTLVQACPAVRVTRRRGPPTDLICVGEAGQCSPERSPGGKAARRVPEHPAVSCPEQDDAPAPWSEFYSLPHRRAAEPPSDSSPSESTRTSPVGSPLSRPSPFGSVIDVSPLARLLRVSGSPPSLAAAAAAAAASLRLAPSGGDGTPVGGKRKRDGSGSPPERPVRPRLSELLSRRHRELALEHDQL